MQENLDNLIKANFNRIMQADDLDQCLPALDKIDDENILVEIVTGIENQEIRMETLKRITSETHLCKVTEKNCGKVAGTTAVDRITDMSLLRKIAEKASNKKVRFHALEKLKSIQGQTDKPSSSDLRDTELSKICEAATKLADSWNWEYVVNKLTEMRQQWKKLDPDWDHELCTSFNTAYESFFKRYEQFQTRQVEEQKKRQERDQKINELERLCKEAESLINTPNVDGENRIKELRLLWQKTYITSGEDFENLEYRFNSGCQKFEESKERVQKEKKKRCETISELEKICEDIEFWSINDDLNTAKNKVTLSSAKWNHVTQNVTDIDNLIARYNEALEKFKSRKKEIEDEQNQRYQENLSNLTALCDKVENLIAAEDRIDAERQVKSAQNDWKKANKNLQISHADRIKLNDRFRQVIDEFYIKQNEFREQQQWEEWANLTVKEGLCHSLEGLVNEEDLFKVAGALKKVKYEWNETGPAPREKSDAIWNRYKAICDQLYGRCKTFFDRLEEEQENNLKLKEEICDKIEALRDNSDWKNTIRTMRSLQAQWRELGPVHRDKEESVNKKFHQACDKYFEGRREFLKVQKEERQGNLEKKQTLCEKIERLIEADDLYPQIDEVKKYNEEWKKIGPASPKNESDLWNRFRTACDTFFNKLDEARPENLTKKQALISDIEKLLSQIKDDSDIEFSELSRIAQELILIQQRWKKIGRVPKEDEKEIWERFNKPCNSFFTLRRKIMERIDGEHYQVIEKKEKLLQELESLTESTDWKTASPEVNRIIGDWQKFGMIPKAKDRKLERHFRKICDRFFDHKRFEVGKLQEKRSGIAKKKEELCIRMELLAGNNKSSESKTSPDNSSLSLSEQLKLAFESNFIVGSSPSKENSGNWHHSLEEAKKIQKSWKDLGSSRGINDKSLSDRFRKACDGFYSNRPKPRQSNKSK